MALISGQPGYVTRFGVVYDNGIKLDQAYDRKHLPPIWMAENCIMELKLRATGEDDPKKQEWVQLPASRIKLERAMLRAGIASCGEMQMLVSDSRFPDEVNCALDFERESLFELNRLCQMCSNFKEQNFVKFGAVCQMAKPACAANIRQLAENLNQFDFAPNVHTPEELGKYMIQQSGHYEYDENLEDFYNYGDYGVKRMLQEDGVFVDRGYVSYYAPRFYLEHPKAISDGFVSVVSLDPSHEAVLHALQRGPYGRCVYQCDNDVVDNQVVNLLYENGVSVSMTMCAFTEHCERIINVMGSRGQIRGNMESSTLEISDFATGNHTTLHVHTPSGGHSGSDAAMMREFLQTLRSGRGSKTSADASVESHLIALAAEESRLQNGTAIHMKEWRTTV